MEVRQKLTPISLAGYFDHTQLKAYATEADFKILCEESAAYHFKMVAVNPAPVAMCKEFLKGTGVHVGAAVDFPLGQNAIEIKLQETIKSIEDGADEIDYVINIGALKEKNYDYLSREMDSIVSICRRHQVVSKVIFENCYLTEEEKRALCRIAMEIRPDYIKTSTGFGTGGATFEDVQLMLDEVQGRIRGKAAGGIRDLKTALRMIDMGVSRIGSTASVSIVEELKRAM